MRKRRWYNNIVFPFLLIASGLYLEWLVSSRFLSNKVAALNSEFLILFLFHLAASGIFALGMYRGSIFYHFESPRNWLIICAILSTSFFLIGFAALSFIFIFLSIKSWPRSNIYDDYEKYITYDYRPGEKHTDPDRLMETIDEELEISPLVDVMSDQDVKLRRGAVNIMERLPKKDAIRLLKMSLQDNNVEIRFYAALGLSKLESEINNNITMAEKEVERNPNSLSARLSLANSYEEYYECGILDDVTAEYYLKLAIKEYYKVLDIDFDNINVLNILANLEAGKHEYDKALAKFKKVCEIDPYNIYANVGMIQCFYETEKVPEAMKRAQEIIKKMPPTKGIMREIIEYWAD